ncbi:hypothetical protein RJT34_31418 [Clitoria ternatea]|uniref:Uncharacterized protein n=1 Tax=Clitoria ternatea TaxID=43366 RepID=A0AAN9EWE7_CLITE
MLLLLIIRTCLTPLRLCFITFRFILLKTTWISGYCIKLSFALSSFSNFCFLFSLSLSDLILSLFFSRPPPPRELPSKFSGSFSSSLLLLGRFLFFFCHS